MTKEKGKGRPDWDAIKRDYGTAKFTFRELEAKHGIKYSSIARKCKQEGWTQDLAKAIKQATNAKLTEHLVNNEANKTAQDVNNTVLAAAEINKQVILKHRTDIAETRGLTVDLMQELRETKLLAEDKELLTQILAGSGASPSDEAQARMIVRKALDVGNRISSAKTLAETFTKLQAAERIAFALDAEGKKPEDEPDTPARIHSFTTEELVAIAGGR
jgi:hypothetical protein